MLLLVVCTQPMYLQGLAGLVFYDHLATCVFEDRGISLDAGGDLFSMTRALHVRADRGVLLEAGWLVFYDQIHL